jgi:prepilin-type N-terminal cleavage/methylation domain-containing protein
MKDKKNKNIFVFSDFFKKKTKAFTLIELLVTISVIALLSALIFTNLKSSREKARIAKSLEFNQTVSNVIGAHSVGIWGFNEGSGNSAIDNSGYNNKGAWSGQASWIANTITQLNLAGNFNGSSYVNITDPSNGILDFGTGDFSLSAWFYLPSSSAVWRSIISKGASLGNAVGYGMEISNQNKITCSIRGAGGSNQRATGAVPKTGVWHYAVCVFDRDNKVFIYLDAKEVASASIVNNSGSVDNAFSFRIGAHSGNGNAANQRFFGQIDEVRIFSSRLAAEEVQKNYADALIEYKNITRK